MPVKIFISTMLSEQEIQNLVQKQIERTEKLGHQSGGSGHMAYVGYKIDEIEITHLPNGKIRVDYRYSTYVETEFTYEPDNPPMEYPSSGSFVIDEENSITKTV